MGWLDKISDNKGAVFAGFAATVFAVGVGMYIFYHSVSIKTTLLKEKKVVNKHL